MSSECYILDAGVILVRTSKTLSIWSFSLGSKTCIATVVGGVLPMLHDGCLIIHEPPILIYHACLLHTSLMLCVVMSMVTV